MSTAIPPRASAKRSRPTSTRGAQGGKSQKQGPQKQGAQSTFRARKRRQQRLLAGAAIVAVLAVVAVIVAVGASSGSGGGVDKRTPVASATYTAVTSVTPDQMANAASKLKVNRPELVSGGSALAAGGKPQVLYIGAEYCPYCAGERWALVMALSHFGTFSGLKSITSSPTDSVASVPTFSFYGSTYSSPYLSFTPVETQTVSGKKLDTLTAGQQHLLQTLDNAPYVPAQSAGGIPFIDLGGYAVQDGIGFDDRSMQQQSFDSIAQQVAQQSTPTAGYIAATAGALTSVLCHLTNGQSTDGGAACKAFPTPLTTTPGA